MHYGKTLGHDVLSRSGCAELILGHHKGCSHGAVGGGEMRYGVEGLLVGQEGGRLECSCDRQRE